MFSILIISTLSKPFIQQNEELNFVSWMRNNNEFYIGDEYHFRLGIFITNLRYIQTFNKNPSRTFRLAANQFACMTRAEYKSILGAKPRIQKNDDSLKKRNFHSQLKDIPESLDWREKGIVNGVRDQGNCGSCWAFSAVCAQEGQWARTKGELLSLSVQNLLDCDDDSEGCGGGWPFSGIFHVISEQNGEWMLENDYPYTSHSSNQCYFDASKGVSKTTKIVQLPINEEKILAACAEYGVISCCIDSSPIDFMYYSEGIFDTDQCNAWELDHAVNIVGYGAEAGTKYWIVRNSWGPKWGENGYIRMIRGTGICGIDMDSLYPVVE